MPELNEKLHGSNEVAIHWLALKQRALGWTAYTVSAQLK
jgi:hypothetical protein